MINVVIIILEECNYEICKPTVFRYKLYDLKIDRNKEDVIVAYKGPQELLKR